MIVFHAGICHVIIPSMYLHHWLSKSLSVFVAQLCPIICDPMGHSTPDSSVREILQARIMEWVTISFSGGYF